MAVFDVEISDGDLAEFFLEVGEALVVGLGERVGYGVQSVGSVGARFPVDGAEDAVFGDGLEGFEETECFQD